MLLARDAQCVDIDLRQNLDMRGRRFNGRRAKLVALQTGRQHVTCDAEQIDRQAWKQPVPNIQSLRRDVEREGDETFVGRACLPGMREGSRQQLVTDAAALMTGCDE